jgi:hypothetical protein
MVILRWARWTSRRHEQGNTKEKHGRWLRLFRRTQHKLLPWIRRMGTRRYIHHDQPLVFPESSSPPRPSSSTPTTGVCLSALLIPPSRARATVVRGATAGAVGGRMRTRCGGDDHGSSEQGRKAVGASATGPWWAHWRMKDPLDPS